MSAEEKIILMFENMKDYEAQLVLVGRLQTIAHRNYEKGVMAHGAQMERSRTMHMAKMDNVIQFPHRQKGRMIV